MKATEPQVVAVVLNYNDARSTRECVESLLASSWKNLNVIAVDNSKDPSLAHIVPRLDGRCTYIDSGGNLGYAAGNNLGIRAALAGGAEFVLVINNDTTVHHKAIEALVRSMLRTEERVGAMCPKTIEGRGTNQKPSIGGMIRWNGSTRHLRDGGRHLVDDGDLIGPLDWIPGAAILFSKRALLEVGYFNPGYFVYYEDVEWSLRARRSGFLLYCCPRAVIFHESEKTTSKARPAFRLYYIIRNQLVTARTCFPRMTAALSIGNTLLFVLPALLFLYTLRYRRTEHFRASVDAVVDGFVGRLPWKYSP